VLLSYLAAIVSVFIWALLPVLIKSTFNELPITYFLVLRFVLATIILMPLFWRERKSLIELPLKTHLIFLGVLGANYWLQSHAIKALPVSWYIVVFALNPLLTLLFLRTSVSRSLLMSIVLGVGGVGFFIGSEGEALGAIPLQSFLYLLGGMLTWVVYSLVARSAQMSISDSALTALTQISSFGAVLILWLMEGFPIESLNEMSRVSWEATILAGLGMPLAYYLYLYSLRRTPVFCQMSQYLELIFGLLFSFIIYREELHAYKIGGGVLILMSLYLSSKAST
jgi:drug/metabolite transporter (DMT)-like permease